MRDTYLEVKCDADHKVPKNRQEGSNQVFLEGKFTEQTCVTAKPGDPRKYLMPNYLLSPHKTRKTTSITPFTPGTLLGFYYPRFLWLPESDTPGNSVLWPCSHNDQTRPSLPCEVLARHHLAQKSHAWKSAFTGEIQAWVLPATLPRGSSCCQKYPKRPCQLAQGLGPFNHFIYKMVTYIVL